MEILKYNDILLSHDECDDIIRLCTNIGLEQATLSATDENGNPARTISPYRTSYNLKLKHNVDDLIDDIFRRVSNIVSLPVENIEMECNKYNVGGLFLPHYDFLQPDWIDGTGGQRLYSCVVYLNDDFDGGQTNFPAISQTIQPVKGKAIVWRNCTEGTNNLEHLSIHESLPVTKGEKWALILWVRESTFISKVFRNI